MARMIWWGGGGWDAAQSHKRNVHGLMNNPAILEFSSSEPETKFCGVILYQTRKATAYIVTRQNTASGSKKCFGGGAGKCGEYHGIQVCAVDMIVVPEVLVTTRATNSNCGYTHRRVNLVSALN